MPESRDHRWLRSFLDLGAQKDQQQISASAVRLQEDTVLAALDVLDHEPGVLLADEVGMGKTYQALGLIACTFEQLDAPHILVVTPRPVLNRQWMRVATRFHEQRFYTFPDNAFCEARHQVSLVEACRTHPVVFAPVNVFTSSRSAGERGSLLKLWFQQRGLWSATRGAIRRRIEAADLAVHEGDRLLGRSIGSFDSVPAAAFRRGERGGGHEGLDDLLASGVEAFRSKYKVMRALDRARFHLLKGLLPNFDLLVVDEAHKLKNPWTVQAQAVSQVLGGKFARAAFLTATPFQLGVRELRQVFALFGRARRVREGFDGDVQRLFGAIERYQHCYGHFEELWRYADEQQATQFAEWYLRQRAHAYTSFEGIDDANVAALARLANELLEIKSAVDGVEPGFRRWTLRSLKPLKKERRDSDAVALVPDDNAMVPLLLYQRLMTERARAGRQTYVAAVMTNVSSSFRAAREGALLSEEAEEPRVLAYRDLLVQILADRRVGHPKIDHVLEDVLGAGDRKEKSLIFCERNATIRALQERLEDRWMQGQLRLWQRLYPSADFEEVFGKGSKDDRVVGLFQKLARRFTMGQDELVLALREALPFTLFVPPDAKGLPPALWRARGWLLQTANAILAEHRASGIYAERLDYRIARRCVDQAVARWFEIHDPAIFELWGGAAQALLESDYLEVGLDRVFDAEEQKIHGQDGRPIQWTISKRTLQRVLTPQRRSIWFPFRSQLAEFDTQHRKQIVDAVSFYLRRRGVPFLVELLRRAGGTGASSARMRQALEKWWVGGTCPWRDQVQELLDYLPLLGESEQQEVLDDALKAGHFVQTTLDAGSRSRRQNAFNTPFYPMVLVGNQAMQEGLDLHRHCRRVMHHDLRWNPADHEQRNGRVDRHGSMSELLFAQGEEGHIHIRYPVLQRTNDPHQYAVVTEREKWFDFLLGQPPAVGEYELGEATLQPLPAEMGEDLRVDLSPRPSCRTKGAVGEGPCTWWFNTDERHSPGATQRLIAAGVAAIWGYPDGTATLARGARAGDTIYAYQNRVGVVARGAVLTGRIYQAPSDDSVFPECSDGNEWHMRVAWKGLAEGAVPPTNGEVRRELGVGLPVRNTFCRLRDPRVRGNLDGHW